ncbi:DNA polymerase III subunit epsilon [Actinomyces viscosus]|uniref:DNA polymerase III subunit epsilon n=1 Tax=Actinomyces viscosus TaxID=1656 RepID=A0A3S5EWN2_ACTVI|nr:exonuclease domain-containing protein [Actinomyces viscosus]TFH53074.1 DNA polymerase III subunit epsilon [Actinomyces viscosus]VEI14179.1 DNA polymerase III subunit epsilon [Actinomyces viscosus]VEI18923.1 DNA polymerase III subunit epsilon [Actinomyces viscosus]
MSTPHSSSVSDAASPAWPFGPLLGFDTETTGVDPSRDRIVTAALVWRSERQADGGRRQSVTTWLADPGVEIPEAASAVHGVTTERARAEGRPVTEVLAEVSDHLVAAMAAGSPVVAFNASYDLTLMEVELARHGLPTMRSRLGRDLGPIADPLVLDRAVDRYRRGKRRLGDLCEVYGVQVDAALHTAEVDVAATLDVLEALATAHPRVSELSAEELVAFQARTHRVWAESFNEWLARRNPSRAPAQTAWPLPDSPVD